MTTPAKYVEFLEEMGIHLEAVDGNLRVTPASKVGPGTIQILRRYKAELLAAIIGSSTLSASTQLQESRELRSYVDADTAVCRRCGSGQMIDIPIHGGRSLRRDCAVCNRFQSFPLWYGRQTT